MKTIFLKIRSDKYCFMIELIKIEGIDPTKSNRSNECLICQYCFLNHEFKFQDSVCYGSWIVGDCGCIQNVLS